jgi:hypothetical protein
MDHKEIQNEKIQKALINIEALQKEYDITLHQYQEAVQNYINTLENSDSISFSSLPSRSWWGTSGINEGPVESKKDCENMCLNSSSCSGATFNPSKHYCWTRTGDGILSVGPASNIALIPQKKADLIVMKGLNDKLLSLNQEIASEIVVIQPQVQQQNNNKNQKQKQLNDTYNKLIEQKLEMEKQLQEYYSVSEDNQEQGLITSQSNLSYRFWVSLTILIIIITLRKMLGQSSTMSAIIWGVIFYILIVFTFTLTYPAGFAIWSLVLLTIILMKMGYLPSP